MIHKEVLENPDTDGRENIARKITEHIPKDSCVVAFNSSFEKGVFEHLANHFPQYEEHLKNLHGNFVDLWDPFKNNFYVSHKMKGLHGIKTVLPALVPDHKDAYKNLDLVKNCLFPEIILTWVFLLLMVLVHLMNSIPLFLCRL